MKIWAHVDDFFTRGPDLESTQQALRLFLDLAVDVGLLYHPKKLSPPSQVQTYTGFIFDTRGIPTLRIPSAKREWALATVEYLVTKLGPISRLTLSVVTGTLESLVEATPNRIRHTYLRSFHSRVHPPGFEAGAQVYYTRCALNASTKEELRWWRAILRKSIGRQARGAKSATLIPTDGAGSGTGTGGTLGLTNKLLQMWMGQRNPVVFSFSSNWRELKPLHLMLLQLYSALQADLAGTTIFYFMDSSATYWIFHAGSSKSPRLHQLIRDIKMIELDLDIQLQTVHVPGLVMIQQGTDGLSRGLSMSPYHEQLGQLKLSSAVFSPLKFDCQLVTSTISDFGLAGKDFWMYQA